MQGAELAAAGVAVHRGRGQIGERWCGRTATALRRGSFAVILDPELQATQRLGIARGDSVVNDW